MNNILNWKKGALAAVLVATVALPALAQGPGGGPGGGPMGGPGRGCDRPAMMMNWFDADGDGKITLEEYKDGQARRFSDLDENNDGKVTLEEMKENWPGRNPARVEMIFTRLDANGDGTLTIEEFNARGEAMFKRLDTNNDGVLTEDELPMAGPAGKCGPGGKGAPFCAPPPPAGGAQ